MKVRVTVVGEHNQKQVTWPDEMPVPRVGETVWFEDSDIPPQYVRHVSYYPESEEPFVYVVLGPRGLG